MNRSQFDEREADVIAVSKLLHMKTVNSLILRVTNISQHQTATKKELKPMAIQELGQNKGRDKKTQNILSERKRGKSLQ